MKKFRTWGTRTVAVALLLALLSPAALAGPQNNKQLDDPNNPWPGVMVGDPTDGGGGKASKIDLGTLRAAILASLKIALGQYNASPAGARPIAPAVRIRTGGSGQ